MNARLNRRRFVQASSGLFISFSFGDPLVALAQGATGAGSVAPPDAATLYAWLAI